MIHVKEIVAPFQTDVHAYIESVKRRGQENCVHRFVTHSIIDSENDRIIHVSVCKLCGLER